jgi:hypothetical protein
VSGLADIYNSFFQDEKRNRRAQSAMANPERKRAAGRPLATVLCPAQAGPAFPA